VRRASLTDLPAEFRRRSRFPSSKTLRPLQDAHNVHVFHYNSEEDRLEFGAAYYQMAREINPLASRADDGLTYSVCAERGADADRRYEQHPLYKELQSREPLLACP